MKISYIGNLKEKKSEGSITILNILKDHFRKYELKINKIDKDTQIVNLHSNGFFESIIYGRIKNNKIYSLHSNVNNDFFKTLKCYFQFLSYFYSSKKDFIDRKERVKKIAMIILSNLTPIFLKRYFLSKMDYVIVPNKITYDRLKLENSQIIRHGINIEKFRLKKPRKNILLKIRFFGHMSPTKGLIEVIKAFGELEKKYQTELFLTITSPQLMQFVKKHSPKTKIHGEIDNMPEEYNNSDIVVLPYRHSGGAIANPLVLLEAMACECAVITTDLPHLKEICGDSVLYVKPYSVKEIVEKVNLLANKPELRKKLGKKARQRIIKYYSEEKMIDKYEKLYRKESFFIYNNKENGSKPHR